MRCCVRQSVDTSNFLGYEQKPLHGLRRPSLKGWQQMGSILCVCGYDGPPLFLAFLWLLPIALHGARDLREASPCLSAPMSILDTFCYSARDREGRV
jgi:hypothetical protein